MSQKQEQLRRAEHERGKLILVVEDDVAIGAFLVQVLEQETPYQALLVPDGLEALNMARQIKPDLLILDYQLPMMSGIQLYDRLHAMQGLTAVPALVMSAWLPTQELEERSLIGLNKPFDLDELLNTVETLLA